MLYRHLALLMLIALLIGLSTDSPASAQAVISSLLSTVPPLVIVSLAAGIVISVGEIDISCGSMFALTGMIFLLGANFFYGDVYTGTSVIPVYLALAASAAATMAVYLAIGLSVTRLGFPALLSTLAVLLAARGLSVYVQNVINSSGGSGQDGQAGIVAGTLTLPPALHPAIGAGWLWCLGATIVLTMWRYKTFSGLRHIAVGMNRQSAESAGLSVREAQLIAFVTAGALVALAAFLSFFQVSGGSWAGNFGWGLELSAIAAAVIGGCRIVGGKFDPVGIVLGAVFVRTTEDAAASFNLPSEFYFIVLGVGLFIAAFLDRLPHSGIASDLKIKSVTPSNS